VTDGATEELERLHASPRRLAVIVPVYGRSDLTASVLRDLQRENDLATTCIVDNEGSYRRTTDEIVLRPGSNLGWAAGCNYGLRAAQRGGYQAFIILNNDVELSLHFLRGLLQAWHETNAGLVAPLYDHSWPHQWPALKVSAANYQPNDHTREIPFADGTCLFIPRDTLTSIGFLDSDSWPSYGWGCDKDYALRVRSAGRSVILTYRSYLNHIGRQTFATMSRYSEREAQAECDRGMATKWGSRWKDTLFDGFPDVSRTDLMQDEIEISRCKDRNYIYKVR
jgi:GT2 family glycosyltransferase